MTISMIWSSRSALPSQKDVAHLFHVEKTRIFMIFNDFNNLDIFLVLGPRPLGPMGPFDFWYFLKTYFMVWDLSRSVPRVFRSSGNPLINLFHLFVNSCRQMPSNATWFRQQVPKCRQMRHGFDNMFQNAVKCDMVSTTSSKMLSNATWFRQHVPNLPNLPTYQPTNLPTYIYIYIYFLCMHNPLVHAQHSCACTGGARAQGQDPTKKRPPPGPDPAAAFLLGPGQIGRASCRERV